MHQQPKISVITVVYNGESLIERTIQSVLQQTYPHIEYLIIDGASTDGTLEKIRLYKSKIDYFISEPDSGIYDAMNKGLKAATGEYVWFMNAGDTIYNKDTLTTIFKNTADADIYYGDTEEVDVNGKKIRMRRMKYPENLTFKSFKMGMVVCHQSIIIKSEKTSLYNLKYQISSDIDWVINALKKSHKIVNTKQTLCKYLIGGKARKNFIRSNAERFFILVKHYGFLPTLMNHFIFLFRFFRFYIVAKIIPSLERN